MSRPVVLVDIGPHPLPVITPVAEIAAPWVPTPYTPPALPPPSAVAVQPVVDGARITWTPADVASATTVLETAPDVEGVPGTWLASPPTTDTTALLSLPGEPRWIRLRTRVNGRSSEATSPVLASRIQAATKAELDVVEGTADHAFKLTQPGSRVKVGDQRNLHPTTIGSIRSLWEGLTLSATYDDATPANVVLSASAATLRTGASGVAYDAASAPLTQARGTAVRYFGYYLDADWDGGARTLNVATSEAELANADGVVWVGEFTVTVPAAATGGSGNTGPGGGSRPPGGIQQIEP